VTTVRNSSPTPPDAGEPKQRPRRSTLNQDRRGRMALPIRSTADSGTNSSASSCLPPRQRPKTWPIASGRSTTTLGRIRPSSGVRPWRQLKQLQHNQQLSCLWTSKVSDFRPSLCSSSLSYWLTDFLSRNIPSSTTLSSLFTLYDFVNLCCMPLSVSLYEQISLF